VKPTIRAIAVSSIEPPIKELEGANRRAANLVPSGYVVLAEKEAIPIPCLRKSGRHSSVRHKQSSSEYRDVA